MVVVKAFWCVFDVSISCVSSGLFDKWWAVWFERRFLMLGGSLIWLVWCWVLVGLVLGVEGFV